MIAAVSEVLQTLGFEDFVVQLNHRALLTAMLEAAGVPPALHGEALIAIDKLDKIGREKVAGDLTARGIDPTAADICLRAFENSDEFNELVGRSEPGAAAGRNIAAIMTLADATPAKGHVRFTPRLARGLSYYTGAIMEIAVEGIGSLGGGGRYDGLIGMFSGEQIPACGFSLGLERILVVMAERNMFEGKLTEPGPDVLVTIFDDDLTAESLRLATELRAADLRVELYPEPLRSGKDLGKAFKYADARQARFVTVVGQDEFQNGQVKIKNMTTGEQQAITRGTVAEVVTAASRLAPRASRIASHGSPLAPRASDTE
jgi:histidyl-tRNA synthetase